MSNVTFIIGNGLDLSLGFKTSYRDFYDYIEKNNLHPKNKIYKAIVEAPKTWADFEIALGQYTRYIDNLPEEDKKNESIKFHEELEELREDLYKYLSKQQKSGENMLNIPTFTETSYFEELPIGQANIIRDSVSQEPLRFHFITLNYTEILEKVLTDIRIRLSRNILFSRPHHIHGTLLENLTLGVSEESQLSDTMSGTEKDDLIKPKLIYSMNDGRMRTLQITIDNSDVIVLFGTSIGETDKYIWELVNNWLTRYTNKYVIVHKHDKAYSDSIRRSSRKQKQFNSSVQDKILRYSGLDGDASTKLRNHIFIMHNTKKLFSINQD